MAHEHHAGHGGAHHDRARQRGHGHAAPDGHAHHAHGHTGPDEHAPATIYTCPMHPQIRQPQPGNCPICGMALEPEMPTASDEPNAEYVDFRRRFWWTLPLTLVVAVVAMLGHRIQLMHPATQNWFELLLSTPVVLWAGWPFFVRWGQSLVNRSPNMWTPIDRKNVV